MAQAVFVDLSRKKFVSSTKGGDTSQPFGTPYHQDILNLTIQPLDYDSSGAQTGTPYETLDASGYSISLLVTKASDGTTLAGPFTTWTPDGTALEGSADLNTVAMAAAFSGLSTSGTLAVVFWVQVSNGSTRKVTVETAVTIAKSAITAGTPSELPITRYPTFEDLASYVKFAGNPNGSTITLPSQDGSNSLVLGANNDSSAAANTQT